MLRDCSKRDHWCCCCCWWWWWWWALMVALVMTQMLMVITLLWPPVFKDNFSWFLGGLERRVFRYGGLAFYWVPFSSSSSCFYPADCWFVSSRSVGYCGCRNYPPTPSLGGSTWLSRFPLSQPGVGIKPCITYFAYFAWTSSLLISAFPVHSTSFSPKPLQTRSAKRVELWKDFDLWLDELCFALI